MRKMDFEKIKRICERNSVLSAKVIDDFLLYYAANRDKLEPEMEKRFARFKHVTGKFQKEWIARLKAQYIAHKIFRHDGLIKGYLNHAALKKLGTEEQKYLENQSERPWRFSFSVIRGRLAEDFFEMEDVFTDEGFLLYSPGVTRILDSQSAILWLNLIAYNGSCWQSFGPIGSYSSFEPDDIFFFATELNPDINGEEELLADLESNPVPYMMLLSGAVTPLIYNKKDQLVHVTAEYPMDSMNTKKLTGSFKTEYNDGVYRLSLKRWSTPPHFAQAYYNEIEKTVFLSSMTDRGFIALANELNKYGYTFSTDPFLRVNLSMLTISSDILKRNIRVNEYDDRFTKETPPSDREVIDKLNRFMELVLPEINAGRQPDIEELALKAGLDKQTALDIFNHLKGRIDKMGSK